MQRGLTNIYTEHRQHGRHHIQDEERLAHAWLRPEGAWPSAQQPSPCAWVIAKHAPLCLPGCSSRSASSARYQHATTRVTLLQCSIIVVGIDGAGKSTVINHLKPAGARQSGEQVPTVGCAVEEIKFGNIFFTVFDMAGGSRYRGMWANYYSEAEAIVYVIDSADAVRMCAPAPVTLACT